LVGLLEADTILFRRRTTTALYVHTVEADLLPLTNLASIPGRDRGISLGTVEDLAAAPLG